MNIGPVPTDTQLWVEECAQPLSKTGCVHEAIDRDQYGRRIAVRLLADGGLDACIDSQPNCFGPAGFGPAGQPALLALSLERRSLVAFPSQRIIDSVCAGDRTRGHRRATRANSTVLFCVGFHLDRVALERATGNVARGKS